MIKVIKNTDRNRRILSAFILHFVSCVILTCARGVRPAPLSGTVPDSVDWIDPDTIRATVKAYPVGEGTDEERRASARDDAVCGAQRMVIDMFVSTICEKMPGVPDYEWVEKTAKANLKNIVISGTLLKEEYGKDQTCSIIYEIRYTGLKTRIDRFQVKEKAGSKKIDGAIIDACRRNAGARIQAELYRDEQNRKKNEAYKKKYEDESLKNEEERLKKLDIEIASIPECDSRKVIPDGFEGDNAYVFTAVYNAPTAITDSNERRRAVARLAVSRVRNDLLNKFVDNFMYQGCPAGACNIQTLRKNITRTFGQVIHNGKVVCSMRENSGHYTIVFRIQKKNLKKELLERSYWGE